MLQFKGFKPNALNKIAGAMGYKGDMSKFKEFVEGDETRKKQMQQYTTAAKKMAKGGMVRKFSNGGMPLEPMPIEGGGGVGLPPPNMSMGFGGASIPPPNMGVMSGGGPPPSDMTQPTFVAPPTMTAPMPIQPATTTTTTTPTTSTPSQFQNQGSFIAPSTPTGPPISTPTIAPVAAQAPVYGQAFTEGMSVGDVTTSMLQNWLIKFLYEPDKLIDNIKLFDEIIDVSSEKDCNMFT